MTLTLQPTRPDIARIIDMAVNGLDSDHSKRAYRRALNDFMEWYDDEGRPGLTRMTVNQYREWMKKVGAKSINQRLSALRRFVREAAANDLIDHATASAIISIKGFAERGTRTGNWLTRSEVEALLNAPDKSLKGRRDRALLGILVGCGLRREEAARLSFEHIQQREGRWAIVDMVGKRNKLRTIPMAAWTKALIDDWVRSAGLTSGYLFPEITRTGRIVTGNSTGMTGSGSQRVSLGHTTPQSIMRMVKLYGGMIKHPDLAPHDLRRTFAKLARKGKAPIEQIQINLGHESLTTTQKYLGTELDFQNAPADYIDIDVSRS